MPTIEKTKRASIVFDDDGVTVLSAFKRVVRVLSDGETSVLLNEADIDLTPDEVKALFGATIDAHLTATNAACAEAEARANALQADKEALTQALADMIALRDEWRRRYERGRQHGSMNP